MQMQIDRRQGTPLYWQIAAQIKRQILSGALPPGAALPSERALADMLGVHRNTVIKAYAHLRDEDLIEAAQGIGHTVGLRSPHECDAGSGGGADAGGGSTRPAGPAGPVKSGKPGKPGRETGVTVSPASERPVRRPVNWSAVIRDEYQDMERTFDQIYLRFAQRTDISLSSGMPPAVYNKEELAAMLVDILLEEGPRAMYLSPYQGDLTLRQRIVSYLRTKGIHATTEQVQVLSETNQALDFLITAMLRPGDCVIIEEPVSPDVYRVISLAGCRAITVPVDRDGILCDRLEPLIQTWHPRFIYVNSSYHDPTGCILSLERRKKLLELSNCYRLPIVEEDAASELSFTDAPLPTLKSMDRSGNVIYIYSFALTFIPGLSMAFVAAPEKLIRSLSYLVSIRIMNLDWLTQKLLARCLTDGTYYANVRRIAAESREKRDLMCEFLDTLGELGLRYERPRGGVYVWCRLPRGLRSKTVAAACAARGVSVIPGEIFYPRRNGGQNDLRLNYSYEPKERIRSGMEIFCEVIRAQCRDRQECGHDGTKRGTPRSGQLVHKKTD